VPIAANASKGRKMKIPSDVDELTALFEKLGARRPELWARSQLSEGINQLQRFLFLRQAWSLIVHEGNTDWVQFEIARAQRYPDEPYAGVGHALRRCVAKGASAQDLTDIVRGKQAELLFNLCYLLGDPSFPEKELSDLGWGLFEVDMNGNPIPPGIGGLHESVLETDPTGREMRPRKDAK
jgi:hypothetical protein